MSQTVRNANQVIITLRYAVNERNPGRIKAAIARAENIDWNSIDGHIEAEYNELFDIAQTILNPKK